MKNILFIPFSSREGNLSLFLRALTWRYNLKNDLQIDKAPDIVTYRRQDETAEDYEEYEAACFKFSIDAITPDTNVYIIADGMGNEHFIANTNSKQDPDAYAMPIELVAHRLKEVGFTSELAKNMKGIKLFICDVNSQNQFLAVNFAKAMGEQYQDLNIFYYTKTVMLPNVIVDQNNLDSHDNFFTPSGSINKTKKHAAAFNGNSHNKLEQIGIAHENRVKINVGECLRTNTEPFPEFVSTFLETNQAKSIQKNPYVMTTISTIEEIDTTEICSSEATSSYVVVEPDETETEGFETNDSIDSYPDASLENEGTIYIGSISDDLAEASPSSITHTTTSASQLSAEDVAEKPNSNAIVVRKDMSIIEYTVHQFFQTKVQQSASLEQPRDQKQQEHSRPEAK